MYAHKRNLYYEEEFKIRENAKTNSKKGIRNKRKEKRAITAGQSFLKKVSHKKKKLCSISCSVQWKQKMFC